MLRRRAVVVASALAASFALATGPAGADDGAGSDGGTIWGIVDEYDGGDDSSGSDSSGDGSDDTSYDGYDDSSSGGSGGSDYCADSLALQMLGVAGGGCGYVPLPDSGDPGVAPVVVDARDQAETAFEQLPLATADVRIAPGPPLPTYPNLETWVWVPQSQWETLELSVTAGATTVHVEARPVRIDIDAGERDTMKYSAAAIDSSFSCSGPGRAWRESLGDDAETSCGYTYQTTSKGNPAGGDHYDLTATIVYEGSWTCVGQCTEDGGSLGEVDGPTGSQPVVVQERQSVVVG
jgi:hypothetical protein